MILQNLHRTQKRKQAMNYFEHPLSTNNIFYTGIYNGFICDTDT